MALIIVSSPGFIELSLDGATDFDPEVDLVALGISKNAPDGLRVRKITFIPSAVDDTVVVRDGQNGPRIFSAVEVLGVYDILKDEYRDDSRVDKGKIMNPYIHFNETVISVANQAYVIFEL
jgi:hypothetical protein